MSPETNFGRSALRLPGRALVGLAMLLAFCALPAPSGAQVVYDNFSASGFPYDPFSGWVVAGPGTFWEQSIGMKFTPSGSGALASIDVAMTLYDGPNHFDLFLYTDAGGALGTLLESWSVDGAMTPWDTPGAPVFVASGLAPLVTAGAFYWLVADTTNDSDATWNLNVTGDMGDILWGPSGGPTDNPDFNVLGAFSVTVSPTAVPESSSVALLLAGGAGCGILLRRRRRP